MDGWIKLHRQLINWEWYDDVNTFRLFIHCLLKANHKDSEWRGQKIKKGGFISSIGKISEETGLTVKQIRLAISKLKRTNEISTISNSKYTVFQVVKYSEYQQEGKQKGKQGANEGQTEGKQRATDKNEKNDKKEKNEKNIREEKFRLAAHTHKNYSKEMINAFCDYWTESKPNGKKMKFELQQTFDIARRLATWSRNDFNGPKAQTQNTAHNGNNTIFEDSL